MGGSRVLGVDGCPGGWIGALVGQDGQVGWRLLPDATAAVAVDAAAVGVDIPVGLSEDDARGCDLAARRRLRPYGSRVFPAPIRAVLGARSYPEGCAISRARHVHGRALSRQTWHILRKIREFDAVLTPAHQSRVIEVHPEVSFARLAGSVLPPKRTPAGRSARLRALTGWVNDPERALRAAPRPARPDDALDALVAAWSALRWYEGTAEVLPADDPPRDARGLRMEIVC